MLVDIGSVNGWAVLVAAVVGYAIGAVWYAPMVVQFFLALVIAAVLAAVVVRFGAVTWIEGAAIGFVLSAGLFATSLLADWMFCGFSMRLYRIQAGYKVVYITAMGAILGAWR